MSLLLSIGSFYATTISFGLAGYWCLNRVGLGPVESWLGGRMMGMVMVAYPAWWAGTLGVRDWRIVGWSVLAVASLTGLGRLWNHRRRIGAILLAEAAFAAVGLLVLLVRRSNGAVLGTEKFMDLGILMSLVRAQGFPPDDMWLAGEPLPYYYWGSFLWVLPQELSRLPAGYTYNLSVAALGGVTFTLALALGSRLTGRVSGGVVAAVLTVLAGTPDGLRQLAGGHALSKVDLWRSSRQHPDVITEFPWFSFWLGDLHPHVLSMPIILLACLVALVGGRTGLRPEILFCLTVLVGVTAAANPWAMPATLLAVVLLLVAGDGRWRWPWTDGGRRWLVVPLLGSGAFIATAPFWVSFESPYRSLGWVHTQTEMPDLLLYAGVLLLPVLGAAYAALRTRVRDPERGRLLAMVVGAAVLIAACLVQRPTLAILTALCVSLVVAGTRDSSHIDRNRPAMLLAGVGVGLLLLPEVIYVVDGYGERLHRMNTVFKCYIQAWLLLSLAWPVLIAIWLPRSGSRWIVTVLLVGVTLPHLFATWRKAGAESLILDGLAWMTPGDRAAVEFLRRAPPGTTIIEAVGDPYSQHARISAASGVPAYLGWQNHEGVWRGANWSSRLDARRYLVDDIYTSGNQERIRERFIEAGADYVVVGAIERSRYPAAALQALRASARTAFEHEDTVLLSFREDR